MFLYANGILILSPVGKLQELLNIVECELQALLDLTINSKKSYYVSVLDAT